MFTIKTIVRVMQHSWARRHLFLAIITNNKVVCPRIIIKDVNVSKIVLIAVHGRATASWRFQLKTRKQCIVKLRNKGIVGGNMRGCRRDFYGPQVFVRKKHKTFAVGTLRL